MKNQAYRMAMLYDFYGDVLTDRQKEFYDLYYNEDLSLGEIAENYGITRQGVRDVIVRAEAALTELGGQDRTHQAIPHHDRPAGAGPRRRPEAGRAVRPAMTTASWRPWPGASWTPPEILLKE